MMQPKCNTSAVNGLYRATNGDTIDIIPSMAVTNNTGFSVIKTPVKGEQSALLGTMSQPFKGCGAKYYDIIAWERTIDNPKMTIKFGDDLKSISDGSQTYTKDANYVRKPMVFHPK